MCPPAWFGKGMIDHDRPAAVAYLAEDRRLAFELLPDSSPKSILSSL
jgi:hypothetical protein